MKERVFRYDLIRTVAIICVILTHLNEFMLALGMDTEYLVFRIGNGISFSQAGVSLFLILSGVLAARSFAYCVKQDQKKAVLTFYKKKALAILTLYYMAYFLIYYYCQELFRPTWLFLTGMDGYLYKMGFDTGYLVGEWFIGVILICYLLCPLLYQFFRKSPKISLACVFLYLAIMVCFAPVPVKETDLLFRIIDFAVGMYLGIHVEKVPKWTSYIFGVILLFLTIVDLPIDLYIKILITGGCAYILLWQAGDFVGGISNTFWKGVRAVCTVIAKYSFAVYLVHSKMFDHLLVRFLPGAGSLLGHIKICVLCIIPVVFYGVILYHAHQGVMKGLKLKR